MITRDTNALKKTASEDGRRTVENLTRAPIKEKKRDAQIIRKIPLCRKENIRLDTEIIFNILILPVTGNCGDDCLFVHLGFLA